MRINIKDSFRQVSGKVAKYVELPQLLLTPYDGSDMHVDTIFGDANLVYADRQDVVIPNSELSQWSSDDSVIINLILKHAGVERA